MTSEPSTERKLRQLDKDVESIYEILNNISSTQSQHGVRLDELAAHLAAHDARFTGIDGRLGGIDGRLSGVEQNLEKVLELLQK